MGQELTPDEGRILGSCGRVLFRQGREMAISGFGRDHLGSSVSLMGPRRKPSGTPRSVQGNGLKAWDSGIVTEQRGGGGGEISGRHRSRGREEASQPSGPTHRYRRGHQLRQGTEE